MLPGTPTAEGWAEREGDAYREGRQRPMRCQGGTKITLGTLMTKGSDSIRAGGKRPAAVKDLVVIRPMGLQAGR